MIISVAPAAVTIKTIPKVIKSGDTIELLCQSSSSNPHSQITWWKQGFLLHSAEQQTISDGQYGGHTTESKLIMNVSSQDDGQVITCQATNKLMQLSVHDAITLNVKCKSDQSF